MPNLRRPEANKLRVPRSAVSGLFIHHFVEDWPKHTQVTMKARPGENRPANRDRAAVRGQGGRERDQGAGSRGFSYQNYIEGLV